MIEYLREEAKVLRRSHPSNSRTAKLIEQAADRLEEVESRLESIGAFLDSTHHNMSQNHIEGPSISELQEMVEVVDNYFNHYYDNKEYTSVRHDPPCAPDPSVIMERMKKALERYRSERNPLGNILSPGEDFRDPLGERVKRLGEIDQELEKVNNYLQGGVKHTGTIGGLRKKMDLMQERQNILEWIIRNQL